MCVTFDVCCCLFFFPQYYYTATSRGEVFLCGLQFSAPKCVGSVVELSCSDELKYIDNNRNRFRWKKVRIH